MSDAREQLRRYLEQRREMGESELMLDTLTVEEALRLIGAPSTGAVARGASLPQSEQQRPQEPSDSSLQPSSERTDSVDWRETLRATGASPADTPKKRVGRYEFPAPDRSDGIQPGTPDAAEPDLSSSPDVSTPRPPGSVSPTEPGSQLSTSTSPLADVPAGITIGAERAIAPSGEIASLETLPEIATHVASCRRCPLAGTAINPVPGEGNPNADLMCVGEAPGATEDETGRPFVGAAGQLLTKILEAIKLPRDQVFICNVLKHRPPGNRNPLPNEIAACTPYLLRQIELVRPKVILALGTFAARTLLDSPLSLSKLRGQIHRYHGVPLIVTYHPAALLRNPSWKRPTWEDVQLARRILDSTRPGS